MKKITLLIVGVLFFAGGLVARPSLARLEERVARHPDNPRALYALTRRYCEVDSAVQAIETYKRLAEVDMKRASEVYLRTHLAVFLEMEPFFPQQVSDSLAYFPRLSPDNKWIVFQSLKQGEPNIAMMAFSGDNFQWITDDQRYNTSPSFAGSTDRFIYVRKTEDEQAVELVYDNQESGEIEVIFRNLSPFVETPDWAGEGEPLIFSYISVDTKSAEVGAYDREEGELIELTDNVYTDRFSRYSSDGGRIVYASDHRLQSDIYVMDSRGKVKERITTWPGSDVYPDFGDKDRKIVFASDRNGEGNFDIFCYDKGSHEVIPVTYNQAMDTSPDLSQDGNWVLFQSTMGDGKPRAYLISLNQPVSAERILAEIEDKGE